MKTTQLFLASCLFLRGIALSQNPYASIGKTAKPMLSLSDGKYIEHFENDSIRQIGSALVNMNTEKIVAFVDRKEQSKKTHSQNNSRFLSIDPLARQFPFYTPYQYAGNTPIQAIDLDGLEQYYSQSGELIGKYGTNTEMRVVDKQYTSLAQQLTTDPSMVANEAINNQLYNKGSSGVFKTTDDAAFDWTFRYQSKSILENREYGSEIYNIEIEGSSYFTYPIPAVGSEGGVTPSKGPEDADAPASIHSHGSYVEKNANGIGYDNNVFSGNDLNTSYIEGQTSYLTTPSGTLKRSEPINEDKGKIKTLSKQIPSDPKDPARKNCIDPSIPEPKLIQKDE